MNQLPPRVAPFPNGLTWPEFPNPQVIVNPGGKRRDVSLTCPPNNPFGMYVIPPIASYAQRISEIPAIDYTKSFTGPWRPTLVGTGDLNTNISELPQVGTYALQDPNYL